MSNLIKMQCLAWKWCVVMLMVTIWFNGESWALNFPLDEPIIIIGIDPCEDVECPDGKTCTLHESWYFGALPRKLPFCEPTVNQCGDNVCPKGWVCELEDVVCSLEPCKPREVCRKPGECQEAESIEYQRRGRCEDDADCKKKRKCCENKIGTKQCAPPKKTRGECPEAELVKPKNWSICEDDGDCNSLRKKICCESVSGSKHCVKRVKSNKEEDEYACPPQSPFCGIFKGLCASDMECEGIQKCCPAGCGTYSCRWPWKANKCNLPCDVGPCRGQKTRWYYNRSSRTCQQFTYGGCDGNGNNFKSQQECETQCITPGSCAREEAVICDMFMCYSDNDCSDPESKCCSNSCGSTECRKAVSRPPKSGVCGRWSRECPEIVEECVDDWDCLDQQICCNNCYPSVNMCVDPLV